MRCAMLTSAALTVCLLACHVRSAVADEPDQAPANNPAANISAGNQSAGNEAAAEPAPAEPADYAVDVHAGQRHVATGLLWLANQQCTSCHNVTVPGHAAHCLRAEGKTEKATYLGLAATPLPPALRAHLHLAPGVGLLVESVEQDSPAQAAGVVAFDVLEKIDAQLAINPEQFGALVRTLKSGDQVSLTLIHESQPQTVQATLGERETPAAATAAVGHGAAVADFDSDGYLDVFVANRDAHWTALNLAKAPANEPPVTFLGVTTTSPPPAVAGQLKLATGAGLIVDAVEAASPAQAAGLEPFDVLTLLDEQRLFNSDQLGVLVRNHQPGDQVQLTLFRSGRETTLQATLAQRPAVASADVPAGQFADVTARWTATRNANVVDERILARWINAGDTRDAAQVAADDVNDETFIRRLYLDLAGILPTPDDVKKFLADTRPDKRNVLVDELLGKPEAISRWKDTVSTLLTDNEHSLTLTSTDGRSRYLVAKDKKGKTLFDGLVETEAQRGTLPAPVATKLSMMLKGLQQQGDAETAAARPADEALQQVLSVDFQETPLREAIDTLRERSGGNIVVHWKSLQAIGIDGQAPITVKLRNVRLSSILKTVLALAAENGAGPDFTVQDEVILIAAPRAQAKSPR